MEFVYEPIGTRVVFGNGSASRIRAEVERLGIERAFLITRRRELAANWAAGVFEEAAMHVPADVAKRARRQASKVSADGLVAVGGGSTIGLAKAIALETSLPIVAAPTTYSGSEMTSIWGLTRDGKKTTGRDLKVLAKTVVYDPELIKTLPPNLAAVSGMNAIAHGVEALYAESENPVVSSMAEEAIRTLAAGLPQKAHAQCLYGAFLAGAALGSVGMALHHKLCHVLGGSFGLPHAETHTVILPHAAAYNHDAALDAMARVARALGAESAPDGLFDLALALDAPTSLSALGMKEIDLDRAAEISTENPYYNPRPVTREGVRALLDDAFHGKRPRT